MKKNVEMSFGKKKDLGHFGGGLSALIFFCTSHNRLRFENKKL